MSIKYDLCAWLASVLAKVLANAAAAKREPLVVFVRVQSEEGVRQWKRKLGVALHWQRGLAQSLASVALVALVDMELLLPFAPLSIWKGQQFFAHLCGKEKALAAHLRVATNRADLVPAKA